MIESGAREIRLHGIGGSPGICIGKAYIVDKEGVDVVEKYAIDTQDLKAEINRFKGAVKSAKDELLAIIENTSGEMRQHSYVLETHLQLLKDKMLYGMTIETIEKEQVNAEWAFKKSVSHVKSLFHGMSDPYLKERADDVGHVADLILRNLTGAKEVNLKKIDSRVILVATDLSPAETSQINLNKIKGFVTDRGGKTSHTSIIARTLGIPAVLGLATVTRTIKNDDLIVVDGTAGIVILNPSEHTLLEFEEHKNTYEEREAIFVRDAHLVAETRDGVQLAVMSNIELPEETGTALKYGSDGIGLYRTEFQYMRRSGFPNEQELFEQYKEVVQALAPKPVTIRTLDINGDKAISKETELNEENPALGLRAIRYCLKKRDIFRTQLRAILRAAVYGNVRILIPMISSCEEILIVKKIIDRVAQDLENHDLSYNPNVEVGIMVEVPSAVIMADAMAEEVDFFSIGTNDLIQYALAIDRNNKEVAHLYQPLHPAILRMLKHVTDVGKQKSIRVSICGEMAGDPLNAPILLGLGFDEISMNPKSIPAVKNMIRSISAAEAEAFTTELLQKTLMKDIISLLHARFGDIKINHNAAAL
ncbi:MAG: phosphoenolpyruvate--protein phosphotransferase [Candidatus Cloacimonadaceae bacterium]|jgi:phosphotransferase system enzyme I (PtsI)|nr:phosphoenolpyruvate--protein phosphotransferase [Candidatus Cloacimonadaceae bacterium]